MTGVLALDNPFTHLVIVCGHGTYCSSDDPRKESTWILEKFRQSDHKTGKPGEHLTFVQHIIAGIEILKTDPTAFLIFSGGCTQNKIPATEGSSYARACHQLGYDDHADRCSIDNYATDSFQNLLFSMLEFKRWVGRYPRTITVITHAFKERRFLECHGPAIRWPQERLRIVGINPSFTRKELEAVQKGEHENAFKHFLSDPYGIKSPLKDKRLARNWNEDRLTQLTDRVNVDPAVMNLLLWQGGATGVEIFSEPLPWTG